MVKVLQILVSLIFFSNKVLVLIGKKSGFLLGAIAALLGVAYFYLLGMYVYVVLELGLIILMMHGFLQKEDARNDRVEQIIRFVTGTVMVVLTFIVFDGAMTAVEFTSAICMLLGTYFLTHQKMSWGWALNAVTHVAAVYLGYAKDQQFFADFQLASAILSIVGMVIAIQKVR